MIFICHFITKAKKNLSTHMQNKMIKVLSILISINDHLPVPFFALARTSFPERAIGMEASWIGEGLSQPFSKIPINNSLFKQNSSKSFPFRSVTSCYQKWKTILAKHRFVKIRFNFSSVLSVMEFSFISKKWRGIQKVIMLAVVFYTTSLNEK